MGRIDGGENRRWVGSTVSQFIGGYVQRPIGSTVGSTADRINGE